MRQTEILGLTLVFIALAFGTQAKLRPGKCPEIPVQQNFSLSAYQGRWYLIGQQKPGPSFLTRCVSEVIYQDPTTGAFDLVAQAVININDTLLVVNGTVAEKDPSRHEGKLVVTYDLGVYKLNSTVFILSTDYKTYSIQYKCVDSYFSHDYTLSVLGRNQTLSTDLEKEDFFSKVNHQLHHLGFSSRELEEVNQLNCSV